MWFDSNVDEGSLQERYEVELTPDAPRRRRSLPRRAAPVEPTVAVRAPVSDEAPPAAFTQSEPLPPEPRTPTSERRRLIATAVGVGVVALFLGWAVGRSGGDSSAIEGGDDSTPPTATTGPPTSAVETAPAVAPSDLPATTRAPRVTTTTVAGWQPAEPIEVSPRIAAMGLDLLVADASGNLTEVATASGEASTIGLRLTTDPGSPLIAGIDWTLVASPNTAQTYLLRGHSQPERVDLGDPWQLRWIPGSDRFWAVPTNITGDTMTVREVLYDGTTTGNQIDVQNNWWVMGADPGGGLVVNPYGLGVYHVDAEGSHRIADGILLGLSPTTAVTADCGAALDECGVYVIDRVSGERRQIEVLVDGVAASFVESAANYGYSSSPNNISPDGRFSVAMVNANTNPQYGLVDLESGEYFRLGDYPESSLWWAPDSTIAMFVSQGQLLAHDLVTHETWSVLPDMSYVATFAVRPTSV